MPVIIGMVITAGSIDYQFRVSPLRSLGPVGLQRIDLLYLNEPAPARELFDLQGQAGVIVFCQACTAPVVERAVVRKVNDLNVAERYGLVTKKGQVGPGYVIIDNRGQVRYQTFDAHLDQHSWEINRLVEGLQ